MVAVSRAGQEGAATARARTCASGSRTWARRAAAGDRRRGGAARAAARRGGDRRGGRAGRRGHRARRPTSTRSPDYKRHLARVLTPARAGGGGRNDVVSFASRPSDVDARPWPARATSPTGAWRRPSTSPPRSSSRCCSRARRASARPRWRARSPRRTGARLIRLQCHEGIDLHHAVYDWDYQRQLLAIRAAEAGAPARELFGREFLLRRPLLEALEHDGAGRCC